MTEFKLNNGQAIELTKDGILIKGDYISLEGSITIVKNSKSASINQITDKGQLLSIVPIDDEETSKDKTIEDVTATLNDRVSKLEAKVTTLVRDRKNINTDLSTNITLDKKQPHVRIEFDDIRDVPKVWVDGELMDDGANDKSLVSLKVDWNGDTRVEGYKEFDINYYDLTGERPISRALREGTPR